jgi:hypothetical protein
MNALPFLKKVIAAFLHLGHESPEVGTLDADAGHDLGIVVRPQQVDFRLPCSSDVNMRRFVIGGVDDEPEAVGAVNDNQRSK